MITPNQMIERMMKVLLKSIERSLDFDFVQALLNNFLKDHQDIIIEDEELTELMVEMNTML